MTHKHYRQEMKFVWEKDIWVCGVCGRPYEPPGHWRKLPKDETWKPWKYGVPRLCLDDLPVIDGVARWHPWIKHYE